MARRIFLGSLVLCVVAASLSQIPDTAILGIHEEPSIILFYGGSGLLAVFFGLLALGSGSYLGITRLASLSDGQRRLLLSVLLIVIVATMIAGVIRFYLAE